MSPHTTDCGDAFGLRIFSPVAVEGVQPLRERPGRRVVIQVLEPRGSLERRGTDEVLYRSGDSEAPRLLIDRRDGGYGVWSPSSGRYQISHDGTQITAVLPQLRWPWQLLFAQVLPIAAAVQGLEVLHASAVAVHGGATAIIAPSGSGKSTMAAALMRRGATFVADDVVALEVQAGEVVAHPGAGIVNASATSMQADFAHQRVIARTAKHHVAVRRAQEPLPLQALVFLERTEAATPPRIERVHAPDPFWLLGSTFVFVVQDSSRLILQLELHQRIASCIPVLHARLPWAEDPDVIGELLAPHLP